MHVFGTHDLINHFTFGAALFAFINNPINLFTVYW